MGPEYVQLHTRILKDRAINDLPAESGWNWVRLLVLAKTNHDRGRVGTVDEAAYLLHVTEDSIRQTVADLDGRIVERGDQLYIRDWTEWQTLTNAERQAEFKEARRNGASAPVTDGNGRTQPVTDGNDRSNKQEQEQELEQEQKQQTSGAAAPDPARNGAKPPRTAKPDAKPREPKPLFDAFCDAWHLPGNGGRRAGLAAEFDRDATAAGATVDEFRRYVSDAQRAGDWAKYVQPHNTATLFLAWRDKARRPVIAI